MCREKSLLKDLLYKDTCLVDLSTWESNLYRSLGFGPYIYFSSLGGPKSFNSLNELGYA